MQDRVLGAPEERIQSEILALLMRAGSHSRLELVGKAGVDLSTVARALPALADAGWLVETAEPVPGRGRGRPSKRVSVRPTHHLAVGVKIGPDRLFGAVTDLAGSTVLATTRDTGSHDPAHVLAQVADLARDMAQTALTDMDDPGARVVGLGVGGHVERARIVAASHILGWRQVDVSTPISEATGLPTVTANDVNALAAGEHWLGYGRSVDDLAVITIGRGLGCGLVLGGRLHVGASGSAGELGHLPLIPDGHRCGCGNRGCLEAVVSDRSVVTAVREATGDPAITELHHVVELARRGDATARDCLASTGELLGRGIASLVNLVNPGLVIVAGEMVTAMDFMEAPLRRATAAHAYSSGWSNCRMIIDRSGDELWARGAAWLAVRAAVRRPGLLTRPGPS